MHNKLATKASDFTVSLLFFVEKLLAISLNNQELMKKPFLTPIIIFLWEKGGYLFFSVQLLFAFFVAKFWRSK